MDMNSVLSYVGLVLMITGIFGLTPVIVSGVFSDGLYWLFLFMSLVCFITGFLLDRSFKKSDINLNSAMFISLLSFIAISLFGSIPYMSYLNPLDAIFESVSGFTTTGMSVIKNPENMPPSILFWRSMTQWIGGVGIIIISILLLNSPGLSSYYLYRAEGKGERIEASVRSSVRKIFFIYLTYTFLGILLFSVAGMPLFESVLNTFTAVSTGGFTTRSGSIGSYGNPFIEIVAIILMIIGATSFFIHARLWDRNIKGYVKNPEVRFFWGLVVVFSGLLTITFIGMPDSFRAGLFQTFSALTTTGFSILTTKPGETAQMLMIILMVIGGCAGSTAGGIKLIRSGVVLKSLSWIGKKLSLPEEAVVPFKFGDKTIKSNELTIILIFTFIYFGVILLSSLVLMMLGYSSLESVFMSASAEGTVGLSVIEPSSLHPLGKIVLMLNMLLGRLEILPFVTVGYVLYTEFVKRKQVI